MSDEESPFSSDPEYLREIAREAAEQAVVLARQAEAEQRAEKAAQAIASSYTIEYEENVPNDPWDNVSYDRFHIDDGKGGETFLRKAAIAFAATRTHYRNNGSMGSVWHGGTWRHRVEGLRADAYVKHLIFKHITDIPGRAKAVYEAVTQAATIGDPPLSKTHLGFLNGDLNLKTLELEKMHPAHGVWSRLQINWNPQSSGTAFQKYVEHQVVAEDLPMLWAMLGDCLVPWLTVDALWLLLGEGRTGKGTILQSLQTILGPYAGVIELSKFGNDKFASSRFQDCTAAIDEDTEARYMEGCAALKRLTSSQGQENYEAKGKDGLKGPRTASIVASSNDKPVFDDPMLAKRLRLIRTHNSFGNRENSMAARHLLLPAELEAMTYQAVMQGLVPLLAGRSVAMSSNSSLVREVRAQGSAVAAWMQDMLDLHYNGESPPPGSSLKVTFQEFQDWCRENGERDMTARRWAADLDRHGRDFGWVERKRCDVQRRVLGVKTLQRGWELMARAPH